MYRLLLIFSCWVPSLVLSAHTMELSSTVLAQRPDGGWVVQVRAALTAFEVGIDTATYTTPEGFRERVLHRLRQSLQLTFNAQTAVLRNGKVTLGHETSAVFEVVGVPDSVYTLRVTNRYFADIYRSKGALVVLREGWAKTPFELRADNDYTADLRLVGQRLVAERALPQPHSHRGRNVLLLISALLVIGLGVWGVRNVKFRM